MTGRSFLVVAGSWCAAGLVTAAFMARRSRDAISWVVFGVLLGPVSVPFAVDEARRARRRASGGRAST